MALTGTDLTRWRRLKPPMRILIIILCIAFIMQIGLGIRLLTGTELDNLHAWFVLPSAAILGFGTCLAYHRYRLMSRQFEGN